MRRKVRLCCGLDETDPDWSDDVLDSDYLNPSFWEIQNKFNFTHMKIVLFVCCVCQILVMVLAQDT
jgi:hypothetical protein